MRQMPLMPQAQQHRQQQAEPILHSPHKRQRQSMPGQAPLPMDDFGLVDWDASGQILINTET